MNIRNEVLAVLGEVLSLKGRASGFALDTPLLGAIPELDSMAVVALITALEEHFGFAIDDDEIDGSVFASPGTLIAFVEGKLASCSPSLAIAFGTSLRPTSFGNMKHLSFRAA
jgi:acyl carrier protein